MCAMVNLFWPCHARHNITSQIVQKTQVRLLSKIAAPPFPLALARDSRRIKVTNDDYQFLQHAKKKQPISTMTVK